jgi:RHS repeat-associated protein
MILDPTATTVRATSSVGNPYMYTGRRLDSEFASTSADTIYYYRARYYDPPQGRFIGRDPLKYVNGPGWYSYVLDNPFAYYDPDGRLVCGPTMRCVDPSLSGENGSQTSSEDTYEERLRDFEQRGYNQFVIDLYKKGHDAFSKLAETLGDMCSNEKCLNTCCTEDICRSDAQRIADAILQKWDSNFAHPSGTRPPPDACGKFFCWDWSQFFANAVEEAQTTGFCFSGNQQWARVPSLSGAETVHFWLEISLGGGTSDDCRVRVDDGFTGKGFVHPPSWPLDDPRWKPPLPGDPFNPPRLPDPTPIE